MLKTNTNGMVHQNVQFLPHMKRYGLVSLNLKKKKKKKKGGSHLDLEQKHTGHEK
jgi:hypothetical protein